MIWIHDTVGGPGIVVSGAAYGLVSISSPDGL